MPLIKCETCNKDISADAKKCPLCGANTRQGKKFQKRSIVIACFVFLLISIFAYFIFHDTAKANSVPKVTETTVDLALENTVWEGNTNVGFLPIDKEWTESSHNDIVLFANKDRDVLIQWREKDAQTMSAAIESSKFVGVATSTYNVLPTETEISSFGKDGLPATKLEISTNANEQLDGYIYIVDRGNGFTEIMIMANRESKLVEYSDYCKKYYSVSN